MPDFMGMPSLAQRSEDRLREDPTARTLATPEENFQYKDFVRRWLGMMGDPRTADAEKIGTQAEKFLAAVRHENVPLDQSLGMAIAETIKLITENAKNQSVDENGQPLPPGKGYEYDSDVIAGAAQEVVKLGYVLAKLTGAIKQGPKSLDEGGAEPDMLGTIQEGAAESPLLAEQLADSNYLDEEQSSIAGNPEDLVDRLDYDFSREEIMFLQDVELVVAQTLGQHMLDSGQLDTEGYQQSAQQQVIAEHQSGALEGQEMNIDPGRVEKYLLRQGQQGGQGRGMD